MKTSDFMYDLPEEQIAQTPIEPRDHSRLMVVTRTGAKPVHRHFYDVIDYLRPGDALVVNETRVIPARLYGERARCCCSSSWAPRPGRRWCGRAKS